MANMTPAARAERARYMREWRRKNPDKLREYDANKWERKAQRAAEEKRKNAENEERAFQDY